MSNINTILNKIAKANKVELAKHEIELALVDEANSLIKIANENIDKIDEAENLFNLTLDKYQAIRDSFLKADSLSLTSSNKLEKNISEINVLINNLKKMSSELGLNYLDIKEAKLLESTLKMAIQYNSGGKKISAEIRKYIK